MDVVWMVFIGDCWVTCQWADVGRGRMRICAEVIVVRVNDYQRSQAQVAALDMGECKAFIYPMCTAYDLCCEV